MALFGTFLRGLTSGHSIHRFRPALRHHLRPGERVIGWAVAEESLPVSVISGVLFAIPLGPELGEATGLVPRALSGVLVLTDQRVGLVDPAALWSRPSAAPLWACDLSRVRIEPPRDPPARSPDRAPKLRTLRYRLRTSNAQAADAPAHRAFLRRLATGTSLELTLGHRDADERLIEGLALLAR
jgi:hypothetical protein